MSLLMTVSVGDLLFGLVISAVGLVFVADPREYGSKLSDFARDFARVRKRPRRQPIVPDDAQRVIFGLVITVIGALVALQAIGIGF